MEGPNLSISGVTTYTAPVETDIEAYRAAGATGIGLWEFKFQDGKDGEVLNAMRSSGLRATLCVPKVPSVCPDRYFTEPTDPGERVKAMCAGIERLAPFDPVAILCVTGDPTGKDAAHMREVTVAGLKEVARFAAGLGLTLGIEPYRAEGGSLVVGVPETLALIDEVSEPNLAMIADTWHLWDQPGIKEDLRAHVDRFIGVQLADRREPNRGWCDRRFPGDGKTDIPSLLGALDAAGYSGWYDIEIFSDNGMFGNHFPDSIWDMSPDDAAREAVASFQKVWSERPLQS